MNGQIQYPDLHFNSQRLRGVTSNKICIKKSFFETLKNQHQVHEYPIFVIIQGNKMGSSLHELIRIQ